jgi:hypothetical protein
MPNFIDHETYAAANQILPDIDRLVKRVMSLMPDFISLHFGPSSDFPVAAACLQDANRTLCEARYALLESFAHKIWYLEKVSPPDEFQAAFFGRFYADDAVLRLYSSAEHLAKALVFIFGVTDDDLKENRKGEGTRFVAVKKILSREQPTHPIALAITELYNSSEWKTAMHYRDTWVHQQPPIVEGLGTVYRRERRWLHSTSDNSYKLGLGNGDEPQYSMDDLHKFILPALFQFADKFGVAAEFYMKELEQKGITIGEHGLQT